MSHDQLVEQLMALPLEQRVDLAQMLWQSIADVPQTDIEDEERKAIALARKRAAELSSGAAVGLSHEEVMREARHGLKCE